LNLDILILNFSLASYFNKLKKNIPKDVYFPIFLASKEGDNYKFMINGMSD